MKRICSKGPSRPRRGVAMAETLAWLLLLLFGFWRATTNVTSGSGVSSGAILPAASPSPLPSPSTGGGGGGGTGSGGGSSNSSGGTGSGSGGGPSLAPEAPAFVQFLPGLLPLGFLVWRKRPRTPSAQV